MKFTEDECSNAGTWCKALCIREQQLRFSPQNEILTETARRQEQVLARLQKALNDKSLVIIVGPGVTLGATADACGKPLPRTTWTGLVRNGLDYILEGEYLDASNKRIRRAYEALEDNDKAGLLDAANTNERSIGPAASIPDLVGIGFREFASGSQASRHIRRVESLTRERSYTAYNQL